MLAQEDLCASGPNQEQVVTVLYRPFDIRYSYYTGKSRGFICRPRGEVMSHLLHEAENPTLCYIRRSRTGRTANFFVSRYITDKTVLSSADNANIAPLYLYPKNNSQQSLCDISTWTPDAEHENRIPNLNPEFVEAFGKHLELTFHPAGASDLVTTFSPRDIFHYIYAIFHCPGYRSRYEQFLKIDFPRVPLPTNTVLFVDLCGLGRKLVALHLLESPVVNNFTTSFPRPGDNLVAKGYPKFVPPTDEKQGRIRINKDQYFEGVKSETWEFHIGGYQVLAKWLKDRRGRQLTYQELTHYQQIIVALQKTMNLMQKIDEIIPLPMVE